MNKASVVLYWAVCLILLTIALIGSACLKPDLDELEFFTVTTEAIRTGDDDGLLGEVMLTGRVDMLNPTVEVDDHGFIFSTDSSLVHSDLLDISDFNIPKGATQIDSPFSTMVNIDINKTYYARAFVQIGERLMIGNVTSFAVNLDMDVSVVERRNDVLFIKTTINTLSADDVFAVTEYGLRISTAENFPDGEVAVIPYPASDWTGMAEDTLFPVSFNTDYYFQPYVIGQEIIYGDVFHYRVEDGWYFVDTLPVIPGLYNAVTIFHENENLVFGGCTFGAFADACDPAFINPKIHRFVQDGAEGAGYWEFYGNMPNGWATAGGVGLSLANTALGGMGKIGSTAAPPVWIDVLSNLPDIYLSCTGDNFPSLSDAVTFRIQDTLYYGSGVDQNGNPSNQFWQFHLNGNCLEVQALPPLPVRNAGENVITIGREAASVLQTGGRTFVGFGGSGPFQLNDVYEFKVREGDEPAQWAFFGFADLVIAREEASSFSVGGRAYLGCGYSATEGFLNDLWEFDPNAPDPWQKREPLPTVGRRSAVGFAANEWGYICGGRYQSFGPTGTVQLLNDTWAYVPSNP